MYQTTMEYNKSFENLLHGKQADRFMEQGKNKDAFGYAFPCGFKGDYADAMAKENVFRRYGTVVHTPAGDNPVLTIVSTGNAELVDDGVAFPESDDSFNSFTSHSYKLASLTKIYTHYIQDNQFDVNAYLKNEFARRFGRAEENIMLNGSGTEEPTGILQTAEVGHTTEALTYDDVISLYFSVKPEYRKNAVWLVNDKTALALRKLKDENGNYLWNPANSTILDRPVVYSPYMPDVEAGAKPIAFGDLSYVWLLIRSPLSIKVLVEKYALQGIFGYAANERFDSKLIRPEAIKVIKIADTEE